LTLFASVAGTGLSVRRRPAITNLADEREQLEALFHLLVRARSRLENMEVDSDPTTTYMHARNARIDLNEALRRLNHLLGNADSYPEATAPD
jgi:hypothetical protein